MLDGPIFDFIRVSVVDGMSPSAIPTLTEVGILGTTPGKAVRNTLRVYSNTTQARADFDEADPEYRMITKVLAQDRYGRRPRRVWVWNVTRTDYRLASVESGFSTTNNKVVFQAQRFGRWGDRLTISALSGSGPNAPWASSISQTLKARFTNPNTALDITQKISPLHVVSVAFVDPEKPNVPFSIAVQNERGLIPPTRHGYRTLQGFEHYRIVITLATDNQENVITTAQEVVDALTDPAAPGYNPDAAALVDVVNAEGSDGSGILNGLDEQMIPVDIAITLPTNDSGDLAYTAQEFIEALGDDTTLLGLLYASHGGASNGLGTMFEVVRSELTPACDFNPQYVADSYTGLRLGDADNVELAVSFTPTANMVAQEARLGLKRFGTIPAGKFVWVEIQTDSTGSPSGTAVGVSARIPASSISPAGYEVVSFPFPRGVSLDANTSYHLVLKGDYDPSTANYIAVVTDEVASGGAAEIKDAAWADDPTKQFAARLYVRSANIQVPLSRLNTPASGIELVRAYNSWKEYARIRKLEMAYFILCTSHEDVPGDTQALSDQIATETAIYLTTNRPDESAEQIKARIDQLASDRTGFIAHTNPAEFPDAVLAGIFVTLAQDPIEPGNFSLFWKVPSLLTPAEWTSTELATLFGMAPGAPAAIVPVEDLGNRFIAGSWTTNSSFLDWTWKKDRIKLEMTMGLFTLMKNRRGITYDGAGIALVENTVRRICQILTKKAFIGARDTARNHGYFELDFPRVWEVDENDFLRRVLKAAVRFQPAWQIEQIELTMYASFNPALTAPPSSSL